jgi:hypothetical protein
MLLFIEDSNPSSIPRKLGSELGLDFAFRIGGVRDATREKKYKRNSIIKSLQHYPVLPTD